MNARSIDCVSVIICTRNRPDTLHQAIASVMAQEYKDFEIIVVDDGSDPSAELFPAEREVAHLIRAVNGKVGAGRSVGLAPRGENSPPTATTTIRGHQATSAASCRT